MRNEFSFPEFQQVITAFENTFTSQFPLTPTNEMRLEVPPSLGHGYVRAIRLREGLDLCIQEHVLKQDLALHFEKLSQWTSCGSLAFCLSGQYSGTFTDIQTDLTMRARDASFCTIPDSAGITQFTAGEHMHMVDIILEPKLMHSLIGQELTHLPQDLREAIQSGACQPSIHFSNISNEIAQVLQKIIHCPYHGKIRDVYLEGKVLELIALYFSQFFQSSRPIPSAFLTYGDVERLHKARDILKQNLMTPPTLEELSQQVGLSERGLQRGFRELFGTTVFALLHNERMEYARHLLETRQMSVGNIADMVGISHRGYFAKAFKRKFGTTPREYMKQFG